MPDITIRIEDKPVLDALNRLSRKMSDLSPVLRVIGEDLVKSTEARFGSQGPAPDGTRWAALSPATLKRKKHSKILTELGHRPGEHPLPAHGDACGGRGDEYGVRGDPSARRNDSTRCPQRNLRPQPEQKRSVQEGDDHRPRLHLSGARNQDSHPSLSGDQPGGQITYFKGNRFSSFKRIERIKCKCEWIGKLVIF